MVIIELCVIVFAPVLIFVIIAQRIPRIEEKRSCKRRHARYKGKFAEE